MEVVVENSRQQIEAMVDVINLSIPRHKHLNEPQRRFFVDNVLLHWRGIDVGKKSGVEELKQTMHLPPKSRQVYKMRGELKQKGWMRKKNGRWSIPNTFLNPFPKELEVRIKVKRNG